MTRIMEVKADHHSKICPLITSHHVLMPHFYGMSVICAYYSLLTGYCYLATSIIPTYPSFLSFHLRLLTINYHLL